MGRKGTEQADEKVELLLFEHNQNHVSKKGVMEGTGSETISFHFL
jgi:hypothetical protein